MKKYKIKHVKFVFTPKQHRGTDWAVPPNVDIGFGSKHTDEWNRYNFNSNHIGVIFSDYLQGDPRKYSRKAKFTESEASILLLKYIEDNLKEARKSKRELFKTLENIENYGVTPHAQSAMFEYALTVNKRELAFNIEAAKIWRKKVREIKKSPEYMWEQLTK